MVTVTTKVLNAQETVSRATLDFISILPPEQREKFKKLEELQKENIAEIERLRKELKLKGVI